MNVGLDVTLLVLVPVDVDVDVAVSGTCRILWDAHCLYDITYIHVTYTTTRMSRCVCRMQHMDGIMSSCYASRMGM